MPEFVVAHGGIQEWLCSGDQLRVGSEERKRNNLKEAHLCRPQSLSFAWNCVDWGHLKQRSPIVNAA